MFAVASVSGERQVELVGKDDLFAAITARTNLVDEYAALSGMRDDASICTSLGLVCCAAGAAIAGTRVCILTHPDGGRILVGQGSGIAIRFAS